MKIVRDNSDLPNYDSAAVSIGNFDGIHAGHRRLVSNLIEQAHLRDLPTVVVTFDPHPIEVLNPGLQLPRITSISRRAELLEKCGVDFLYVLSTNERLLELDYQDFFDSYVVQQLKSRVLVEGPNFFFGKDRQGNTERLRELCHEHEIDLTIVEICETEQGVTSSSAIRQLILSGEMETANALLVDVYQLQGQVAAGAARGREIGFPTANLSDIEVLIPGEGVYAGRTRIEEENIACAIHIGPNPTFGDEQRKVEVHLIGKQMTLYGQEIQVDVLKRIRGVQKFSNQEDLVAQIRKDVEQIEAYLSKSESSN